MGVEQEPEIGLDVITADKRRMGSEAEETGSLHSCSNQPAGSHTGSKGGCETNQQPQLRALPVGPDLPGVVRCCFICLPSWRRGSAGDQHLPEHWVLDLHPQILILTQGFKECPSCLFHYNYVMYWTKELCLILQPRQDIFRISVTSV